MELSKPLLCDLDLPSVILSSVQEDFSESSSCYTSIFVKLFLTANNIPLSKLVRHYQVVVVDDRRIYIMRTLLDYKHIRLSIYGRGDSIAVASDRSCFELSRKILEVVPSFIMPTTVQGLVLSSNERVYINAILPLFHFQPFVDNLIHHYGERLRLSLLSSEDQGVSGNLHEKKWITLYGEMLQIYRSYASLQPSERNAVSSSSGMDKKPFIASTDLLTQACNIVFSTQNGDDRNAYGFIVKRLTSEMPSLSTKLFLYIECDFTCRACSGGPFTSVYTLSQIQIPYDCDMQSYLDNLLTLVSEQRLRSQHQLNDYKCTDEIRGFKKASLRSLPYLLCFVTGNKFPKDRRRSVPDILSLTFQGQEHIFHRYANTVCFQTYMDKEGNFLGDFYHVPEEGDVSVSEHSYLVIRTQERFIEVNKGLLYEADDRVLPYMFPRSLYFYLHESLLKYLPRIDQMNVSENPLI